MLCAQTSGPASTVVVDGVEVPAEVAEQRLDEHVRPQLLQAPHGPRDVLGAAVEQVVAVDHRHDDVLQRQLRERPRHVLGLAHVDRAARVAGGDRAEAAPARARVAEEHHGRGALAPALAHVRAAGFLADRVQVEAAERGLELGVALAPGRADLEPRRLRGGQHPGLN